MKEERMKATTVVSPLHVTLDLSPALHVMFKALVAFLALRLSNYLSVSFSALCPLALWMCCQELWVQCRQ